MQSSPELIAETALVSLTLIAYVLPRRADLVPIFDSSLGQNIDAILSQGSVLLRARMSLLLGYYADMLFGRDEQAFIKSIDFLFRSVSLTGPQKAVALQSADTLNTIVKDKDLWPRLSPHIGTLVQILTECNQRVSIMLYFNFHKSFVKFFRRVLGANAVPLLGSLVQRVLDELKYCHEKGEKNNIVINKCWGVIRQIVEEPLFVPLLDQFEQ